MPRRARLAPLLALVVAALPGCSVWFLEPDPNQLAPVVAAPELGLPSAQGPTVTLAGLRARGHVVLVFYRSYG